MSEDFIGADDWISRRLWLDEVESVRIFGYHVGVRRKLGAEQRLNPADGQKCSDGVQPGSAVLRLDTNILEDQRKHVPALFALGMPW